MTPGLTTMLGVSHQAIDDIALMRALPNMTVVEPSGPTHVASAVRLAAKHPGPVYLRLMRASTENPILDCDHPFEIGKMSTLCDGDDGLFIACGAMVTVAKQAADDLAREGISICVVDMSTIKPLDAEIIDVARKKRTVVTVENHSIIGGLGSAIAELLLENGVAVRLARVGVDDTFAEGGTTPYLFTKYGLHKDAVIAAYRKCAGRAG
jgi:transketolase